MNPEALFALIIIFRRRTWHFNGAETMNKELEMLNDEIRECFLCELSKSRINAVCGTGHVQSSIMLLGEAPGKSEDIGGVPFTGRSGKLMRKIMSETGIDPDDLYISNSVRCRPAGNKTPSMKYIRSCNGYLNREIRIIDPRIIVPLGNIPLKAIGTLSGIKIEVIGKSIGKIILWHNVKIIPQYHPAAILRDRNKLTMFKKIFEKVKKINDGI